MTLTTVLSNMVLLQDASSVALENRYHSALKVLFLVSLHNTRHSLKAKIRLVAASHLLRLFTSPWREISRS
jgi:hypothetical protein